MPYHPDDLATTNMLLAKAIREVSRRREESWVENPNWKPGHSMNPGRYGKSQDQCIAEVVGDDPIAKVLACLFTAGYCEMFEFCGEVLGPLPAEPDSTPRED